MRPLRFIPGANTDEETIKRNIRQNVQRDIPWLDYGETKEGPLSIVAGGPSLSDHWPRLLAEDSDILALNNAYGYLTARDIIPDYFMLLDARRENIDFLFFPTKAHKETTYYIAAQAHPEIFDRLAPYDLRLYLTSSPATPDLVRHIDRPKRLLHGVVGTVGIKALALGYVLGYRKFRLYGYDSSYKRGAHHAFEQKLNDKAKTIEVFLENKRYITTPNLAHQATEFAQQARDMVTARGCEIELRCEGLLPDMVAVNNKRGEIPLTERERAKYQAMWDIADYRKHAPGEYHAHAAIEALGMRPGESVIDFGCGCGRGAAKLQALGMQVTGVDFAPNCLDPGVNVPFVMACLWELPDTLEAADYAYCTDVMEHIPTEQVEAVLKGIAARCRKGAYFNIDTCPDKMGGIIGHKLHMTVADASAWAQVLQRHWPNVEVRESEGSVVFVATHEACAQQPQAVGG